MSTTTLGKGARGSFILWIAVLAVLVILGIVAWVTQLNQGMSVTGINQVVVWGFYIGTFFLLAGTASGLLLLAALAHVGVIPSLDRYRRDLLIASVGTYIAAGIVILMDIGHPERVLQFLTSPRFLSPFVWDFYSLGLAVLVALVYLFLAPKATWMAWVAGIVSLAVIFAEGLLMSVNGARPVWDSPLTPFLFFVEAMIASCALVYLVTRDEKVNRVMLAALRVLLPSLLAMIAIEAITVMYGGEFEAKQAMGLMLTGNLSPLFWTEIVLGILVPIFIFAFKSPAKIIAGPAAILAVLGILLAKLNLLVAGQAYPMLDKPAYYTPTMVELGGVVGVVALATLLFAIGRRLLPSKG